MLTVVVCRRNYGVVDDGAAVLTPRPLVHAQFNEYPVARGVEATSDNGRFLSVARNTEIQPSLRVA